MDFQISMLNCMLSLFQLIKFTSSVLDMARALNKEQSIVSLSYSWAGQSAEIEWWFYLLSIRRKLLRIQIFIQAEIVFKTDSLLLCDYIAQRNNVCLFAEWSINTHYSLKLKSRDFVNCNTDHCIPRASIGQESHWAFCIYLATLWLCHSILTSEKAVTSSR